MKELCRIAVSLEDREVLKLNEQCNSNCGPVILHVDWLGFEPLSVEA